MYGRLEINTKSYHRGQDNCVTPLSHHSEYQLLLNSRIALGFITYGINFGITRLSGSIYLNIFLFKLVQIPSKGIAIWLQNRYVLYIVTVVKL